MSQVSLIDGHDDAVKQGDLISRSALLEKSYWHGDRPDVGNPYADGTAAVDVCDIEDAPAVDAVPVVRCKDCTEWDKEEQECSHWYGFRENDFCSYGERKDDGICKKD